MVGSSDCQFKPGDLVRVEASDMGEMTTIKKLDQESGSQIATEQDEEMSKSVQ
jgi:hypothetical protein